MTALAIVLLKPACNNISLPSPEASVYHFIEAVCVLFTDILGHGKDTHFQHIGTECHSYLITCPELKPRLGDTSVDFYSSLLAGLFGHGAPFDYPGILKIFVESHVRCIKKSGQPSGYPHLFVFKWITC